MDENKIISLENLNQYSDETSDKIKSYVDTKTSVIQDGTKTVGGVSAEDYNNFKGAYENKHTHSNKSVLDEISEKTLNGGEELSGSTGYTVTDSVEYPLVGMKVFGKSTQDGTPTPENPVEIVSVVEPTVTVCGKNLLNLPDYTGTSNGVTCSIKNGIITLNGTSTATTYFNFWNVSSVFENETYFYSYNTANGVQITLVNNVGKWDQEPTFFNSTNRSKKINKSGELACTIYIPPNTVCNNTFAPQLELGSTATDYEPYTANTLTLPDTLNAIPVTSGGNVVIDGQEYIADYVDFERGVKVQRVGVVELSELSWTLNNTGTYKYWTNTTVTDGKKVKTYFTINNILAEKYIAGNWNQCVIKENFVKNQIAYTFPEGFNIACQNGSETEKPSGKFIYELAIPIETPIPESELQAYRQLHTYNGVTNISNDKGAGLSVQYCTSKMLAEYALPLIKDLEAENAKKDEEISALKTDILTNEKIHNRIYEGINLAEKFASEIAAAPYNGDAWAWIKARITAENFTGICVGDYIPFTTTNGVTLNAQIAGINTYKNYGDTPVGSHIDFICKELWGTLHSVNKVEYNNGTESQSHPWLASDLYLYLNSLSGSVPNSATVNPEMVDVDYTTDGVYYYLPEALKNVIIEKRFLLPKRYSASGLLTDDNNFGWVNIGKLWLPDECEVYGMPVWGGKGGYSLGGSSLQYPIFIGNINRLKFRNGIRYNWWLLSPYSGSTTHWCFVSNVGSCNAYSLIDSNIAVPVCFRV